MTNIENRGGDDRGYKDQARILLMSLDKPQQIRVIKKPDETCDAALRRLRRTHLNDTTMNNVDPYAIPTMGSIRDTMNTIGLQPYPATLLTIYTLLRFVNGKKGDNQKPD